MVLSMIGQEAELLRRRDFITVLCAATWSLAARAQQPAKTVIGFLSNASSDAYAPFVAAFRAGLAETGHVEGNNLAIEFLWADGQYSRLPALAEEFVRRRVSLIVATGGIISARAAKAATASIPIVFTSGFDPVAYGVVASLNKPGGNLTGVYFFTAEFSAKRIDILRQLAPTGTIALLVNPGNPNVALELQDARAAAELAGQPIRIVNASSERDLDDLSASFDRERPSALLIGSDPFFTAHRQRLIAIGARYAVPAMYGDRQTVLDGGLLSYGASIADVYRQAGVYAGKILSGAKPADLPILQPTKLELIINLKTAKALNLAIPPALLALADEVVE
jgi:putative tryptophan/tyrosine transport system substrate-binding protein